MTEAIGNAIYMVFVVFCGMGLVGLIYYFILVLIGLGSNIINMVMTAGAIFFLHHYFISGGVKEASEFNFIFWEPGVFVFAPIGAVVTVLFVYMFAD